MWRCVDLTNELLTNLVLCDKVDEIIIIDNDTNITPDLEVLLNDKIKIINQQENIGVNPAWNLGVKLSKNDKLCIVNDDIVFDTNVFNKIDQYVTPEYGVHGIVVGDEKLGQPASTDYSIDFYKWEPGKIIHCFGQLMFIHKANWEDIPNELVINFGDDAIFHYQVVKNRTNLLIYNIEFRSPMSQTVKDTTVKLVTVERFNQEQAFFNKWFYEKIEENKMKKKILIAIPTARYIEPDTFKSIYDLEIPNGYEITFQYFYGYSVSQVRNLIANWVVNGYDYLFAVDHDVIFDKLTLKKMIEHDKPLVSGIYRQRLPVQAIEIYDLNLKRMKYEDIHSKGLIRIGACGFGCVLVKKEVFSAIGYPWFVYHEALNHNDTFSEDLDFCKKALERNIEMYCDTSIICGHYGHKNYEIEFNKIENENSRLRELSSQRLLPQDHINYLQYMKTDLNINPKIIYDIGACVLHWTNEAKRVWDNSVYYAFEAMSATEFLYKEQDIKFHLGPLGSNDYEEVTFYENLEHPGGNSLFKENSELSPMADVLFPEDKKVTKVMRTLDSVVKENNFPYPDLIKMDIQGAELSVLKGATKVLQNCNHLILELQHVDYNKGAPKANEVIEYLESIGFKNANDGMFCGSDLGVDGDYHFIRS